MSKIRLVVEADAPAIHEIYTPYVLNTPISFELEPPTVEQIAGRIHKYTVKYPWLVFEDDNGTVAGYAYTSAHRERVAYQWSVDVAIYVRPDTQRKGIGRRLYTPLFDMVRLQGYVNAYAGIALPNDASVGVHEAMGFVPVGIYRNVGFKLGKWHDVGWWSLALQSPPVPPSAPRLLAEVLETEEGRNVLARAND